MSRHEDTVIRATVIYDRANRHVLVRTSDGRTSSHGEAAERLDQAVAGLRRAEEAAARSLVVAECAMNNVAGQYGLHQFRCGLSSTVQS